MGYSLIRKDTSYWNGSPTSFTKSLIPVLDSVRNSLGTQIVSHGSCFQKHMNNVLEIVELDALQGRTDLRW